MVRPFSPDGSKRTESKINLVHVGSPHRQGALSASDWGDST